MPRLFVTGGSGFIGRRVVARLAGMGDHVCLSRAAPGSAKNDGCTWVQGDLAEGFDATPHLEGLDAIVHLAALTGKARADQYDRVNVAGTAALLAAAERAGVSRFVFVSTVATRYPELKRYPYARSKSAAEELVRAAPLDWTILRPTVVLGPGSPIFDSLAGLAKLPITPLFGAGRVQLQPVLADDVASAIVDAIGPDTVGQTIDVGGPDRLDFDTFMQKLRVARGGQKGPLFHLPVVPTMAVLGAVESLAGPALPVTAGQLYAFRYDSTAEATPFMASRQDKLTGIDDMIAQSTKS